MGLDLRVGLSQSLHTRVQAIVSSGAPFSSLFKRGNIFFLEFGGQLMRSNRTAVEGVDLYLY